MAEKSEYGRELHKAGKSAKAWDNFVKNSHKYSTNKGSAVKKVLEKHGERTKFEKRHGWPAGMKEKVREDRKLGEKHLKNI